jgi:phosphatidylglycerol---prolipoprotein diacylglyceryl transferase
LRFSPSGLGYLTCGLGRQEKLMRQVLFDIPLDWLHAGWHIPIYGYGLMLFLAYLLCTALARRLCKWQGIDGTLMNDLAIWLFVSGILGGRLVFVIQYWHTFKDWTQIFRIMDGGLVLYGALIGGAFGYFAYFHYVLRRHGVSNWKMLDVIAPCLALGIALGRIGCLCTGCCYGNVACTPSLALHFPYQSPAWEKMVRLGYQSPLGFILKGDSTAIEAVEPGSSAAQAGLETGDVITEVECDVDGVVHKIPVSSARVFKEIQGTSLTEYPPRVALRGFAIDRAASLGFVFRGPTLEVGAVDPDSVAGKAGLRPGDLIADAEIETNGKTKKIVVSHMDDFRALEGTLNLTVVRLGDALAEVDLEVDGKTKTMRVYRREDARSHPTALHLTVRRGGADLTIPAFAPTSIGVNPTQIYETISMCLLLFFLVSYFPYRRHEGELLVLFMFGYAVHRYLNEMLRTDTDPVAFGLTLSQKISIAVLAAAAVLAYVVWWRPLISQTPPPPAPPETTIVQSTPTGSTTA